MMMGGQPRPGWSHHLAPPRYSTTHIPMRKPTNQRNLCTTTIIGESCSGFLSFGDGIQSDHHMIWIDLHLLEICLKQQDAHIKPMARWLQCKDPHVVNWYNTILLKILDKQNLPQWINQLSDTLLLPTDLWWWHRQELNAIDLALTQACRGAKNQCHKLKCGQVQWCPHITMAINKILFWKSMLKWELGGKVGISILKQWAHKAKIKAIPSPESSQSAPSRNSYPMHTNNSNTWKRQH